MTGKFILFLTLLYAAFPSQSPGAVIYVKATASGTATNGLSWDTAFRKIQSGINAAAPGDELWVAAGTYPEHLTLKDGVRLFGGFDGIATHPANAIGTFTNPSSMAARVEGLSLLMLASMRWQREWTDSS